MVRHVLLGIGLVLVACGGADENGTTNTSTSGNGGAGGNGSSGGSGGLQPTMITVSGALTGTRSGPPAEVSWSKENDVSSFVVIAQSDPPFWASITFNFDGEPTMTPYSETGAGVLCAVAVTDASTPTNSWLASKGALNETDRGTCSLTLTSIALELETDTQKQYETDGSVLAVLPVYVGNGSGDVTLEATF